MPRPASAAIAAALAQWRSIRSASVFRPRKRQEAVERAGDAADRVLEKGHALAKFARFRPPPAIPPTMSEWPFRYLVAECMTMSMPSSIGRCTQGLAKVLSATGQDAALAANCASASKIDQLQQRVGGRLDPDQLGLRPQRRFTASRSARSTRTIRKPGRALAAPARTAGNCRHRDRPSRPHGRRRRASPAIVAVAAIPDAKAKPARPALQIGDAALKSHAGRVLAARILVALMNAGAFLHEGGGGVDRHHHRPRRWIGVLAGMDRAGGKARPVAAGRGRFGHLGSFHSGLGAGG